MEYEIVDKNRFTVTFKANADRRLSNEELGHIQGKLGYIIFGYGYPSKVKEKEENFRFFYTWECSGSCD